MTRSSYHAPLAEGLAVVGIAFGAWLLQHTFQPASDAPNFVLLAIGGLDMLLCFALLGYFLRARLREGQALPKSWIVTAVVLSGAYLGWIAALMMDAHRLLIETQHLRDSEQQVVTMEDSLRQFSQVLPMTNVPLERNAWQTNHDRYARVHDQLTGALRSKPDWHKELARIDDQVQQMDKLFVLLFAENSFEQRIKWRTDFMQTSAKAVEQAEALRTEIVQSDRDLALTYRSRWQAIGSLALTGVFLVGGCMVLWLVFDRELRHRGRVQNRLAAAEAHFRSLVEHQPDAVAVLDASMNIQYVNPAWKTAYNYEADEVQGRNLLEMIHPEDRPRVQAALHAYDVLSTTKCRLSAEYGVWHDVEMQCQEHDDEKMAVVRIQKVRASALPALVTPAVPQPDTTLLQKRLAEAEQQLQSLRDSEQHARSELQHHQWLLGTHKEVSTEGVLILSATGQILSWNPAFTQIWKLSNETMSGHTWATIAAHMETQARTGWDEFQHAAEPPNSTQTDSCWEMHLEGNRVVEVYAQVVRDHPNSVAAIQFHFRDVTRHKELESQLRDHDEQTHHWKKALGEHEEHKKTYEVTLRDREKHLKHLEKRLRDHENRFKELEATLLEKDGHHEHLKNQLHERDRHRAELEDTLRDHQERLHDLHQSHERHADNLKAGKESMRRLANGIASDFNRILSVILGNADVLHESLPKDHLAQSYVDEIKQAASHGAELSQRLLAYSRNHLLQMVPIDMNRQLSTLEPKFREALGHDVQLQWDYANQELWVKTDPHPLEQALLHVLTHARQHMPHGGTMTIHTERVNLSKKQMTHADMAPGAYTQVRLQDTSDGMDDETVTHVFEPYHPTREGQKGDLTLATAYGIIRQSGGCIEVDSKKGQGSVWTILLPCTDERPPEMRASA